MQPFLATPRLQLYTPAAADAGEMLAYHERNRDHFVQWQPRRGAGFYTSEGMTARIRDMQAATERQEALHLIIRMRGAREIIGECGFTNIVRGPFRACHLGFSISREHEGKGLMREALQAAVGHVFGEMRLHRIMANYRPENARSAALLRRLGFEHEGRARSYLEINGEWADHVLTALINPDVPACG